MCESVVGGSRPRGTGEVLTYTDRPAARFRTGKTETGPRTALPTGSNLTQHSTARGTASPPEHRLRIGKDGHPRAADPLPKPTPARPASLPSRLSPRVDTYFLRCGRGNLLLGFVRGETRGSRRQIGGRKREVCGSEP